MDSQSGPVQGGDDVIERRIGHYGQVEQAACGRADHLGGRGIHTSPYEHHRIRPGGIGRTDHGSRVAGVLSFSEDDDERRPLQRGGQRS